MKKVFLVIPIGLISVAAVGVGLFLRPGDVKNSVSQNPPPTPPFLKGESEGISAPQITLPSLDQPQITTEELKNFEIDSDADGLTDFVENFYQTDPNRADSDGDGYRDGEEVTNGFNPLGDGSL